MKELVRSDSLGPEGTKFMEFAKKRVKGQNKALHRLAKAVDYAVSPLRDKSRPIFSHLVIGGSGSGKTLLVDVLSEFWFKTKLGYLELPCHSFSPESFSPNQMISADLHYQKESNPEFKKVFDAYSAAHEKMSNLAQDIQNCEAGQVNKEAFKKLQGDYARAMKEFQNLQNLLNPKFDAMRTIVVFDGLESANDSFRKHIIDILGAGYLYGEKGPVNFKNAIVIITCNNFIGVGKKEKKMGFHGDDAEQKDEAGPRDGFYLNNIGTIKSYFPKNFLSRIDRIELLASYDAKVLSEIFDLTMEDFIARLSPVFPVLLAMDPAVKDFIVEESSDHVLEQGIWLLKAKFKKHVINPVGLLMASHKIAKGAKVHVGLSGSGDSRKVTYSVES